MTEYINTAEEQKESEEHTQAMIEKGEQIIQNNDPNQADRPDWLPEKFQSVEQMAEAYSNLEKKLGSQSNKTDEPEQEQEEAVTQQEELPSNEEVVQAVNEAGLDFDSLQDEYNELGGLSQETMLELEKAGFPQDLVNSWVQGQEALALSYQTSVYELVGGEESYNSMLEWASENLQEGEVQAYDRAIDSGDLDLVRLAVAGLQNKYQSVEGSDPSLIEGQSSNSTGGTYGSWAEVTAAMRDSRYDSDPAYRQQVTSKLGRSQL